MIMLQLFMNPIYKPPSKIFYSRFFYYNPPLKLFSIFIVTINRSEFDFDALKGTLDRPPSPPDFSRIDLSLLCKQTVGAMLIIFRA